mgnify:CR=1 FL=1
MPFALRSSSLRVLSQAVRLFALRSVAFAPAALCLCRSLPAAPHPGGILRISATCRPASHLFDSASASLRLNNLAEKRSGVPTPCPGIYRRGCGSRPIRSGWRGGWWRTVGLPSVVPPSSRPPCQMAVVHSSTVDYSRRWPVP